MKKPLLTPVTIAAIKADIKESYLGHLWLMLLGLVLLALFGALCILALSALENTLTTIVTCIPLSLAAFLLIALPAQTVRAFITLRTFHITIDERPATLIEITKAPYVRGGGKRQYYFQFPRDSWSAPYLCYTWRGPDAMTLDTLCSNSKAGESTFYLVRDARGRLLYAYDTKVFTLSEELAPYVKNFRKKKR